MISGLCRLASGRAPVTAWGMAIGAVILVVS